MTDEAKTGGPGYARRCWALIAPYWSSEERWLARGLLAVIVALNLGQVYLSVLLNGWRNDFYNSLQELNEPAFRAALFRFTYLAFAFIVVAVYSSYLNQMLQIRWRRWLTARYVRDWLAHQHYYRIQQIVGGADNPDQRIAEDVNQFISLTLGLALGLLSAVVTLFSFLFVLWTLSGPLSFTLRGHAVVIPGYMVWVALVYAVLGTWITMRLGRPLIRINFFQQRFEADFRYSLVRLRENSESVAFYRGEALEQENFAGRFAAIFGNYWQMMKRQKILNWFSNGYSQIAVIFPYIVTAPAFFAGKMKLGGMMQTASAFGEVQGALSYFIEAYTSIATWRAVIDRLLGFRDRLAAADAAEASALVRGESPDAALRVTGLTVRLPGGEALFSDLNLTVAPGGSLLIGGPSGSGKSTLLRTLAGLWPYGEGSVLLPQGARSLFLPQRAYLPLGSLRRAVQYPLEAVEEGAAEEAMQACGLAHFIARLDEEGNWAQSLSPGEQQRLAFARALLAWPDFLFLDEASSALDEGSEAHLYALLKTRLPNAALISVGHRSTLRQWHEEALTLGVGDAGA